MKLFAVSTILLLAAVVQAQTALPLQRYTLVTACGVEFELPSEVTFFRAGGRDSCVDQYRSDQVMVTLDLFNVGGSAHHSRREEFEGGKDFVYKKTTIGGRDAEIMTFVLTGEISDDGPGRYRALMFVPYINDDGANLTLWINAVTNEKRSDAMHAFETLKFPDLSKGNR